MSKITYIKTNVGEGFGQSLRKSLQGKGVSHCHHLQLLLHFVHGKHLVLFRPPLDGFRDQVSGDESTGNVVVVLVATVLSSEMTRTLSLQVFLPSALSISTCPLPKSKILIHAIFISEMPSVHVSSSSLPPLARSGSG